MKNEKKTVFVTSVALSIINTFYSLIYDMIVLNYSNTVATCHNLVAFAHITMVSWLLFLFLNLANEGILPMALHC
jgi:hypothetical protein